MKDFKDNELAVGDKVIFAYATDGYLREGVIHKFTPQGISIKHEVHDYANWKQNVATPLKTITTNLIGANSRVLKVA